MNRLLEKLILLACFLDTGCLANGAELDRGDPQGQVEFRGSNGVIRIEVEALTISINGHNYPLENCSNTELHCFKSSEIGFHVVFPRDCHGPYQATEVAGGARFLQIAMALHQTAREGRYSSELSDRFAYDYRLRGGLRAIRFDPSGRWRFGPNSNGDAMASEALEPFIYRLSEGRSFLQCR